MGLHISVPVFFAGVVTALQAYALLQGVMLPLVAEGTGWPSAFAAR